MAVKVRDRNFIMSTVVTMVLILAMMGFQAWMASRSSTTTVAVVSAEGRSLAESVGKAMAGKEDQGGQGDGDSLKVVQAADEAAGRQLVLDDKADLLLVQHGQGWQVAGNDEPSDRIPTYVRQVVNAQVLAQTAAKAGTTPQAIAQQTTVTTAGLSGKDQVQSVAQLVLGGIFAALFYMAALMFGMQIAQSVIEEKQSRIVEILASAIPVRQLLAGKVVGNTIMATAQIVLYLGIGLIGVSFTPYKAMLTGLAGSAVWYIAFFLAGFLALSCIWAVAGSLATRNEDLQQTTTPLTMVLVLGFFGSIGAQGSVKAALSYIPVISSMIMPGRLYDGSAAWWEGLLALALTIAFAAVAIVLGERMYRRSLMQTSSRMTFKQALRSAD
ncbi:hypothetical protein ADJ73_03665 [Arsenicicoccus sp. oral taxon 190]|nr:hypothetical protein ADJ73_03665 [Arsenicicoccus sp. oral taxon 190]